MLTNPIPLGFPSVSSCFMLPPPLPVTSCHNTTRYPTPKGGYFFGTHFTKCHYKYYLLVERSQAGISPIGPLPTRTGMCTKPGNRIRNTRLFGRLQCLFRYSVDDKNPNIIFGSFCLFCIVITENGFLLPNS